MVAGSGGSLWLLLLCALTTLLIRTGHCSEKFPICDIPCCTVLPNCSNALHVTCECPELESVSLQEGDLPESVQAIHISKATNAIIYENAVKGLQSLTNFSLHNMHKVEIHRDGLALRKESKIRSINIQAAEIIRINGKAFSGDWEPKANIRISDASALYIEPNAFDYSSVSLGPNIALHHIGKLTLAPKGFTAAINELSLMNVDMHKCHGESFGGNIFSTELTNVTITEAKSRCFNGMGDSTTFSILSSRLKTVKPQAFSGKIRELIIKNSNFTTVQERSFQARVMNMQISSSYFQNLNSNGLSVKANDSIRLENVRVDFLRTNALAGLQIERSKAGTDQPLIIRKLEILEAEDGSLAFSECARVRMTDLDIVAPWPRVCPTEKWTRKVTGGDGNRYLSPAQYQVFFQLQGRRLCSEDGWNPFPTAGDNPRCSGQVGSRHGHRDDDASDDDGQDVAAHKDSLDDASDDDGQDVAAHKDSLDDASDDDDQDIVAHEGNLDDAIQWYSKNDAYPRDSGVDSPHGGSSEPASSATSTSSASSASSASTAATSSDVGVSKTTGKEEGGTLHIDKGLVVASHEDEKEETGIPRTQTGTADSSHASHEDKIRRGVDDGTSSSGFNNNNNNSNSNSIEIASGTSKESVSIDSRHGDQEDPIKAAASWRTEDPDGLTAADEPSPASDAVLADVHHRLLLYLALGAVLALAAVLAAALLLLLVRRRQHTGQPAEDRQAPMETLAVVLANRLLRQEDKEHEEHCSSGPQRKPNTAQSSARTSIDYHQYEPIREDLLLPLPIDPPDPEPAQLIFLDECPLDDNQLYHHLVNR